MSKLIDADALREDILNDSIFDNDTINYYLSMVDGMEDAYDADKVINSIETVMTKGCHHLSTEHCMKYGTVGGCIDCMFDRIKDVVKGGGQGE